MLREALKSDADVPGDENEWSSTSRTHMPFRPKIRGPDETV